MLVIFISCLGLSLEAILVAGGLRTKLAQRFPLFYSYVLFVFVQDVLRSIVYRWYSELYPNVYWVSQFVALVLGCIVVFEICRVGLRDRHPTVPAGTRSCRCHMPRAGADRG